MRASFLAIGLSLIGCGASQGLTEGAPADYWSPQELITEDHTYSPTVRAVQLFKKGFELSQPVLELNSVDHLVLRFDDLQPDPEQLSYTLVHCDAAWQPSDLATSQFVAGDPLGNIPPAKQSYMTLQPFIEYQVEVPSANMRFLISGNYLLKVFRGTDQDDLVLTRRFMVFEQKVDIQARVQSSREVELRDIAQQVDFTIGYPGIQVNDPFSDIKVTVLQNMRWDDARTDLRPKFLRDHELVYDYPKASQFLGGNEWRGIDIKNLRYVTQRVQRIATNPDGLAEVLMLKDEKRDIKVYLDIADINGKYLVRNDQVDGDPLGADHVWVDFILPLEAPLTSGDIYVYGGFSDFQCKKENRMVWSPEDRSYLLRTMMKQGYIDYCFAFLPNGSTKPDLTTLEGSHFQTENDYAVLVYLRDFTIRTDRLVGVRFVNSRRG